MTAEKYVVYRARGLDIRWLVDVAVIDDPERWQVTWSDDDEEAIEVDYVGAVGLALRVGGGVCEA